MCIVILLKNGDNIENVREFELHFNVSIKSYLFPEYDENISNLFSFLKYVIEGI